jgi:transcriptional regulator with XRE-family HTH domain
MTEKVENPAVNERIKQLRTILKISQVNFAKKIHISKGYQAEIELGHCKVNERILALIAGAFPVRQKWLETGDGPMFTPTEGKCLTAEQRLDRMTTLFGELYPEFQDYILNQIDQLVGLQDIKRK